MITQGEWTISHHDDNDDLVIRADDERIIANLEVDKYMMNDDEIYDNALLIKIAPIMYKFIKEISSMQGEGMGDNASDIDNLAEEASQILTNSKLKD